MNLFKQPLNDVCILKILDQFICPNSGIKILQYPIHEHMVNKQEVVGILTNVSKFEESQEELIRGTAEREQMNWSIFFRMLLLLQQQ